jgi:hypothetical protein
MITYGSHEGTGTIYDSHGCLTSMCGNQVWLAWMFVAQVNLGYPGASDFRRYLLISFSNHADTVEAFSPFTVNIKARGSEVHSVTYPPQTPSSPARVATCPH